MRDRMEWIFLARQAELSIEFVNPDSGLQFLAVVRKIERSHPIADLPAGRRDALISIEKGAGECGVTAGKLHPERNRHVIHDDLSVPETLRSCAPSASRQQDNQ